MGTYFIVRVITGFGNVIITLICLLQAIMSWFVSAMPPGVIRFYNLLASLTEPFVRPFRKLTARFAYSMGIDFSPLIAIIAIQLICRLIAVLILSI